MTPTTTVTTTTRRRRRSTAAGVYVHEAHPASPRRGSTVGTTQFDHVDTTAPSHRHFYSPFSGSAQFSRPNFSIESGWVDGIPEAPVYARGEIEELPEGDDDYVEHGRDPDAEHDAYNDRNNYEHNNDLYDDDEEDDLRYYEKANNKAHVKKPSVSTMNGTTSGVRRNTFGIPINGVELGQKLAPATPPSPPRPWPNGQKIHSSPQAILAPLNLNVPHVQSTKKSMPVASTSKAKPVPARTKPPPPPLPPIQTQLPLQTQPAPAQHAHVLDTTTEISLLQENFNLLRTVLEDLEIMCTWFFAQRPVEAYTEHVDVCAAIENSVQLVLESLTRRRKLGEEEWNVRSPGWHQKYTRRMYSLNRTLFRLLSIRPTIEDRGVLKSHQTNAVLKKLQEHQNKMADLARKFQGSFDRLKLRHIHYLLTKAHEEAHQRSQARKLDEASFESQWYEDKNVRADLRREFYAAQRTTYPRVQ
ncbi:hypothetical protein FA13DRAFT_1725877 [Coprinellus micaceus]|uniref:Uncharacterized protein n=1 Tax=Coprinellus micaceus TaxID=71717 RepID=A0A4Y7TVN3_COPMI|nr:hypothetical protein FA13DRAFT_1725877 [Coprinellus micaceus]